MLIAEAKVSLVRVKELEDQLKLEEEQKSELHDQVKKLETQLRLVQEEKHKLQRQEQWSDKHRRELVGLLRREEREVEEKRAELKELEEKHSEEIMEKHYEALDQQGALEREQKNNMELEHALELEQEKTAKLEQRTVQLEQAVEGWEYRWETALEKMAGLQAGLQA